MKVRKQLGMSLEPYGSCKINQTDQKNMAERAATANPAALTTALSVKRVTTCVVAAMAVLEESDPAE